MKKINLILLTILNLLFISSCESQISLVKEFDQNEYICSYGNFEGVNLYATFNSSNNTIKIYNDQHTELKSLDYRPNENLTMVLIYGLSKDVFNLDSNIEFLIQSFNGLGESKMQLIDEKNLVLKEFETSTVLIRTIGNKNYFIESVSKTMVDKNLKQARTNQTTKLYSIDGKFRRIRQ